MGILSNDFFEDNATILFFILVFLILFWGCRRPGCFGGFDPK
ncbi:MAG: hypothetical protein QHH06_09510 [Clostridiales bacterium]|nr:hypothetical protein [Eubacteriales bacterium]MDH7566700.1 hypothetical protein [Clostridiales bacterium]